MDSNWTIYSKKNKCRIINTTTVQQWASCSQFGPTYRMIRLEIHWNVLYSYIFTINPSASQLYFVPFCSFQWKAVAIAAKQYKSKKGHTRIKQPLFFFENSVHTTHCSCCYWTIFVRYALFYLLVAQSYIVTPVYYSHE